MAAFLLAGGLPAALEGCASPAGTNSIASVVHLSVKAKSAGDLFVSNFYASEILIYPANAKNPEPAGSITDGVSSPYNLAVDRAGTLYVQNNNNTISEYPMGASDPSKTLTEPKEGYGSSVSRSTAETTSSGEGGRVMKFKPGATSGKDLGIDVETQGGIAIDSHDNLLVDDQGNRVIEIFKKGAKTPFRAIARNDTSTS